MIAAALYNFHLLLFIFIKQFLFLLLFMMCGAIIGKALLIRFSFLNIRENYAFSVSIGWAAFAILLMLLGFIGLFRSFVVFPLLGITLLVSLLAVIRHANLNIRSLPYYLRVILSAVSYRTVFLPYFTFLFLLTAYPITVFDSVSYHLPVAREFVNQGRIVEMPFLRFPVNPQLMNLFFSFALMCGNSLFANLIQYAMLIILVLLIYSFAERYFNKEIGLFSALIFLTSPAVPGLSLMPHTDIGAVLFCFLGFYALCILFTDKNKGYGLISAIFFGVSFGIKYVSVVFFLIVFLVTMIIFNKEKQLSLFYVALITLLIAFPWYLRNRIYSGDWFFPYYPINNFWDPADVQSHFAHMRSFGLGRSFRELLSLPINLLQYSDRFQESIGPFIILGIASIAFIKKWTRIVTACALIAAIYILFWFYTYQILRYLLVVFPLLAILGGWSLENIGFLINDKRKYFSSLMLFILIFFVYINCIKIAENHGFLPYTDIQRIEYIAERRPTYKAIIFLNSIKDATVYSLFDEGSVFYHKNKVIGDWVGPAAYKKFAIYIADPPLLYSILKGYGVKYLLINLKNIKKYIVNLKNTESELPLSVLLKDSRFELVYRDLNAVVFKIL